MTQLDETWRKSTRSNNNGACAEVRKANGMVEIRDTKAGTGGLVLSFTEKEWEAFTAGVEDGEFQF